MLMGMPLMIQPSPTLLSLGIEAGFPVEMINANTNTFNNVMGIAIEWIYKRFLGSYELPFCGFHHAIIADSKLE